MSLANIGLELARTGRRVLLVDFDLESPGIDTFEQLQQKEPHPGIVDYVSDYVATKHAPDVKDYIYEALGIGQKGGRLWVMPSGTYDTKYSKKLSNINWRKLYEELDGFLMFEDLKAQWEKSFNPHYILIDSRTGHTDTEGICTRQLPDAVVVVFFPNEQNLAGLKTTVSAIRAENEFRKDKTITIHFVMSNVPDLDDEQEILSDLQQRFRRELKYKELTSIIHRYESLSLLKQSLFLVERPKSRLAKEYLVLLNAIVSQNIEDREAVIQNLREKPYLRLNLFEESQQKQNDKILKYHSKDGEILYLLAMDLKHRGQSEDSQSILKRSIDLGYQSPEALLERAEIRLAEGEKDLSKACSEVWEAFQYKELDEDELTRGVEILRQIDPKEILKISTAPAFTSLSGHQCAWVAGKIMTSKEGLEAAVDLLSRCRKNSNLTVMSEGNIKESLMLALIGLGRFEEAMRLYGRIRPHPEDLEIIDAFNYGMAEWGATSIPHQDIFRRVVALDSKTRDRYRANYCQCVALSLWVIGRNQDALKSLDDAIKQITEKPTSDFSCWRYMRVSPSEFIEDCDSIRKLIDGVKVEPLFFQ